MKVRITTKKELRECIENLPERLTVREMIDLYRELRYRGYVEVATDLQD